MDVIRTLRLLKKNWNPWPEGSAGLKVRDHRQMVGGAWGQIGQLQFEMLKKEGLKPEHVVLDIGCGSFRAGRFLVDYLEPGNYIAVDKQEELVAAGREKEIGETVWKEKRPEVVITDSFEFGGLSRRPDYAIAQSVFTHLTASDIRLCLKNLSEIVPEHCRMYATYFVSERPVGNLLGSHSSRRFEFTVDQIEEMGAESGWVSQYIGDWGHPRDQKLVLYLRKGADSTARV